MLHLALVLLAGFVAGTMNAVAGGGSFISFPALVFVGLPPVVANASSTVALVPGAFASAWAYREDFRSVRGMPLRWLLPASLAGALLLLSTPAHLFDAVVPWLLLTGTLAFAFGRQAGRMLARVLRVGSGVLLGTQLLLAVYGGYFGGAVGIMMMAAWSLFGLTDIRAMSATRTILVGATNTAAVLCFVVTGLVRWPETLVMLAASGCARR
jgi:uncharacterized membrane protein YfcA